MPNQLQRQFDEKQRLLICERSNALSDLLGTSWLESELNQITCTLVYTISCAAFCCSIMSNQGNHSQTVLIQVWDLFLVSQHLFPSPQPGFVIIFCLWNGLWLVLQRSLRLVLLHLQNALKKKASKQTIKQSARKYKILIQGLFLHSVFHPNPFHGFGASCCEVANP